MESVTLEQIEFELWVWQLTDCCQHCEAKPGYWGECPYSAEFHGGGGNCCCCDDCRMDCSNDR